MRLIDADSLLREFRNPYLCNVTQKHISLIANAPTIDPVRHGRWVLATDACGRRAVAIYRCSECKYAVKYTAFVRQRYCPNCGARMDGEEK